MKRTGKESPEFVSLTSDEGLKKSILVEGSGDVIPSGVVAIVHYTGKLKDGSIFDSSVKRGTPFKFNLGLPPLRC